MTYTVYVIRNLIHGKCYVGLTTRLDFRWADHKSDAKRRAELPLHRAMKKFGVDKFECCVLEAVATRAQGILREGYWIAKLKTLTPRGYNTATQGNAMPGIRNPFYGKTHKEESLLKQRTVKLGKKASEETKKKMSAVRKGVPKSLEHRAKIAASNIGKHVTLKGVPRSEEVKRKISESKMGAKLINGKFVKM